MLIVRDDKIYYPAHGPEILEPQVAYFAFQDHRGRGRKHSRMFELETIRSIRRSRLFTKMFRKVCMQQQLVPICYCYYLVEQKKEANGRISMVGTF